jgi:hypothetical protein
MLDEGMIGNTYFGLFLQVPDYAVSFIRGKSLK